MKSVLLIDATPMFREFLKEKLAAEKIEVHTAQGHRDAFLKVSSIIPDLIILDIETSVDDMMDFLSQKRSDPNAASIPVIISGPLIEREKVAGLVPFGVVKYFTKPIKFDIFFDSIGRLLKVALSMDTTPCVLDIHLNDNIIFIEIAQGLNREKIALLKYKLTELINRNKLTNPKVILMMSDLDLTFVDAPNLELLFDNLIAEPRISNKNIKVLSMSDFTKELISGHPAYAGIAIADNLSSILNSVVDGNAGGDAQDLISDKILESTGEEDEGSIEMRFYSDAGVVDKAADDETSAIKIAVVDDDAVVRQLLQGAFTTIGAKTDTFGSGSEFLNAINKTEYSLVILDIFMPGISGFDILNILHSKFYKTPIIIYSQAIQREAVVQALSLGAKSYFAKPQKPEVIIKRAIELLHDKI